MSTYVYMRLLESAPYRYDLGIRLLSFGRVDRLYQSAAEAAVRAPGERVLEIGCGTGNLTRALLDRGANVIAVDQNPEMLAVAREKLSATGAEMREMVAAEIGDRFPADDFDAVAGALVFSEMSEEEQLYVLRAAHRILRPGGRIVIADEVRPQRAWQRISHFLLRLPAAVVTYVLTQTTTWALREPAAKLRDAGFRIEHEERFALGSMAVLTATKPAGDQRPATQ